MGVNNSETFNSRFPKVWNISQRPESDWHQSTLRQFIKPVYTIIKFIKSKSTNICRQKHIFSCCTDTSQEVSNACTSTSTHRFFQVVLIRDGGSEIMCIYKKLKQKLYIKEQRLQLKMKLFLGYNLKIVIYRCVGRGKKRYFQMGRNEQTCLIEHSSIT